jgi:hypothetical protein
LAKRKIANYFKDILMKEHTLFNRTPVNSSLTRFYPQHNKVSEDGSHAKRKRSVATQQISGFPASFDLTTLNGANGFVVNGGRSIGYQVGSAVSTAGDINGDGKADLVLGAQRYSDHVDAVFVIFGQSSFPAAFNLTTLNGTNGFVITGTSSDGLGSSVGTTGDINGDGKDDLVLGAPMTYSNNRGAAYVIFGQSSFPSSFNLSTLNGTNGFVVNGLDSFGRLGWSVNTAGDINGDGKADLVLGAPYTYSNNGGAAYVIFGQSSFPAFFDLSTLNGTNGFVVNGLDLRSFLGWSVNTVGDINGDGKADLVVGAPGRMGHALLIFGQSSFPSSFDILTMNGTNGFWVGGIIPATSLGESVSTAGDVNGDGKDDLVLGDPQLDRFKGAAYVIFGQSNFSSSFNLSTLNGTNGFVVYGVETVGFGSQVSPAGDINRDGKADIVVGARAVSNAAGAAYIIFGQSSFPPSFNVSILNGANGFVVNGISSGDLFGAQVSTAGDMNGDGKADLVVSAPQVKDNGTITGADYVIFQFNTAPVVINPIPDQTVMVNQPFNFTVLNNTFSDPDVNSLVYSAEQTNGNLLPSWLAFNNKSGFFSGVAPTAGTTPLSVSASDPYGLSTHANFSLSAKADSSSSASLGTIVGSVVGGVLGVSALIGLGYGFFRKRISSSWLSRPQNSLELENIESTPLKQGVAQ